MSSHDIVDKRSEKLVDHINLILASDRKAALFCGGWDRLL